MANCLYTNFRPYLRLPGSNQEERLLQSLDPENLKIDARSVVDILDFIKRFARQVNYYDKDLNISDWLAFFQDSIPFTVASIAKINLNDEENRYIQISELSLEEPTSYHLQLQIDHLYKEILLPWQDWQVKLNQIDNSVGFFINNAINNQLRIALLSVIGLCNGGAKNYGVSKPDFNIFQQNEVWRLELTDLYAIDESFLNEPGGMTAQMISLKEKLDSNSRIFFESLNGLIQKTNESEIIEESIIPKKESDRENHAAHLSLLFVFIKLFEEVKGDLNKLTAKHLEFFYFNVLRINFKKSVPDEAHIIFEPQKHIDQELLKKGVRLKDGKDLNKSDVFFALNEEILVDKAKIKNLRTLYLNQQTWYKNGQEQAPALEGLYIAPTANSKDGFGKGFEDTDSKAWPTLGAKESEQILEENHSAINHPTAKLGFVLASPILLLNEGKRTIDISIEMEQNDIDCIETPTITRAIAIEINTALQKKYYWITAEGLLTLTKLNPSEKALEYLYKLLEDKSPNKLLSDLNQLDNGGNDIFEADDKVKIKEAFELKCPFKLNLSGEKEWIIPKNSMVTFSKPGIYKLEITIELAPDEPAITFFNAETLMDNFKTQLPLVKIELDDDLKFPGLSEEYNPDCCLERVQDGKQIEISFYHYFRHLVITDTSIEVNVCGVKNFIVQNDENLQDVNSPVYPFGVRPNVIGFSINDPKPSEPNLVGPNFYLGSKEVFCKKWNKINLNLNWKDKPSSFKELYAGYIRDGLDFRKFEVNVSVLEEGKWKKENIPIPFPCIDEDKAREQLKNDLGWSQADIDAEVANNYPTLRIENNPSTNHNNRKLFVSNCKSLCDSYYDADEYEQIIELENSAFNLDQKFRDLDKPMEPPISEFTVDNRNGFVRFTLEGQDFLHKDYAFVLARQMMAFGRLPDTDMVSGAVYIDTNGLPQVFSFNFLFGAIQANVGSLIKQFIDAELANIIDDILSIIDNAVTSVNTNINFIAAAAVFSNLSAAITNFIGLLASNILSSGDSGEIKIIYDELLDAIKALLADINLSKSDIDDALKAQIDAKIQLFIDGLTSIDIIGIPWVAKAVLIPNEPWTPIIKNMALDYTASAAIEDIELIHLYPFEHTFVEEDLLSTPSVLPVFSEEGNLFIGLENLTPGNNLHILFQLAEATADSELNKAIVKWYYLKNDQWHRLLEDFDVLEDKTKGLTRSGIIKMAIPDDINDDNTIMPKDQYWLKVTALKNVKAIAKTINIHTQAARATFSIAGTNDLSRLKTALPAGSIAKFEEANTNIKKVEQPYVGFAGKIPEKSNLYYRRVSEHLRHKGRAIARFDYERLLLERFDQISKAKCINHTHGLPARKYQFDFNMAPGFVLVAVIPNLEKLATGNLITPSAPVSLLEEIRDYLRAKNSTFIRLKIMNPRYERVNIETKVKLIRGKSEAFYKVKLENEMITQLAPWSAGDTSLLEFGRKVSKSDIIKFIESRDYVDYICSIKMQHGEYPGSDPDPKVLYPLTARSILTAGNMMISILDKPCEEYDDSGILCNDGIPELNGT